jgi:acetyl esterase
MALTEQEKQYWENIIKNTGAHREVAKQVREIPVWYQKCLDKVKRQEIVLDLENSSVPVRCVISFSKDRVQDGPVYINMHGGGFVFPQDKDDDLFCAHVASAIQGIVVDIDYALCPEYAFPIAMEQCYAVCKWVFRQCEKWKADNKKVSIGGHSAGGNLAAAIVLKAMGTKEFTFCLQILDYAAMDFNTDPMDKPGSYERMMPVERERAFTAFYVGGDLNLTKSPFVSPSLATDEMLIGQPKTLIMSAGTCNFRFENEKYGNRLVTLGVEVSMKRFLNSRHGFTIRMMDEWEEAQNLIIRYLKESGLE